MTAYRIRTTAATDEIRRALRIALDGGNVDRIIVYDGVANHSLSVERDGRIYRHSSGPAGQTLGAPVYMGRRDL